MKAGKVQLFAGVVSVVSLMSFQAVAETASTDLEWKEMVGTNRPPESISSMTCSAAVSAITCSEEESPEFRLNTNPPGFCLHLR